LVLNASHPPFFCMPGRGGNALLTLNLPVLLGQDHPFLILDAPGVTGSQPPFTRLEELGAYLVDQMKKIQPTGPYMLGGHSFGGIVAYEVAQQLLAAGDEVSLLVIFDTNAMIMRNFYQRLPIARRIIFKTALLKSQAGFHITRISTLPNKEKLSYLFFRVKKRLPFAKKEILLSDETSTTPLALRSVEDANIQAISSYQPKPYPGKITLFRASQPHPAIADKNRLGWGEFIRGEIEIIDVPGDHVSIFNLQNIEVLAAKLMRAIDQVNDEQRRK
jgi:thioesterase domain-containing protein